MPRKDPDFMPAFVLNQILGGGGFASRLMEEVREKRGLAYSVYSYVQPFRHTSIFSGGVATKNEAIGQSLDIIRAELKQMADGRADADELDNAKKYLIGSYALRFDTNAKIATQLLGMLQEDFGLDYVENAQQPDRGGDARRRQARRQAPARDRGSDRHHRRQAQGPAARQRRLAQLIARLRAELPRLHVAGEQG